MALPLTPPLTCDTCDSGRVQPNPRIPDPAGARMAELVRARVPDEVRALRDRLTRLRREYQDAPAVMAEIDQASRALDDLTMALVRDLVDADDPDRPQRH